MKKFDNIRIYAWIEFVIWLVIVAILVFGIRYHHYQAQKQYKNYQIFMEDVDGLIVGSPVKFLGCSPHTSWDQCFLKSLVRLTSATVAQG